MFNSFTSLINNSPISKISPKYSLIIAATSVVMLISFGVSNKGIANTITLDDFVLNVVENSSSVRSAEADYRTAMAQLIGGASPILPHVSISDTTMLNPETVVFEGQDVTLDDHTTSLISSMSLFQGFGNVIGLYAAYQGYSASSEYLIAAQEDARLSARAAFLSSLRAFDNLDVAKEAELMASEQYTNSRNLFNSGLITRTELLNSEVNYLSSQQNSSLAQLNFNTTIYSMENLILQDLPTNIILETIEIPEVSDYDYDSLEQMMADNRSEIIALSKSLDAQTSLIFRALGQFLPTADVSYSRIERDFTAANNVDTSNSDDTLALNLRYDIFEGFSNIANLQVERASAYRVKHQLIALVQEMKTQLKTSVEDYSIKLNIYSTALKKLEASELAYQDATLQYSEGVITQTELLQSFTNLVGSSHEYTNSKYDIILSIFQLERATQTILRLDVEEGSEKDSQA